jgi:Ni/Fe-hydrogenase subunit HybB-like protein
MMSTLHSSDWAGDVFITLLAVVSVIQNLSLWRGGRAETNLMKQKRPGWWPGVQEDPIRALARAYPSIAIGLVTIAVTVNAYIAEHYIGRDTWISIVYVIGGIATALAIGIAISVFLFNSPRFLVPPRLRNDRPLIKTTKRQ